MFLAGYPQSHAEFVQRTTKVDPASKINRGEINPAKHAVNQDGETCNSWLRPHPAALAISTRSALAASGVRRP